MNKGELDLYLKHLDAFALHYKNSKFSLLAKIFGVFTIKTEGTGMVHVMVMENTLQLKNPKELTHLFDLKGSWVDRRTKGKNLEPSETLKDSNFIDC